MYNYMFLLQSRHVPWKIQT